MLASLAALEGVPLSQGAASEAACFLLGKFELYIADTYNVARFCRERFACGLIIDVCSVHAASILDVPDAIAKPETCMFGGYKAVGKLNNVGGAAPNVGLRLKIEARARQDTAWTTIDHDKMTEHAWCSGRAVDVVRRRLAQVAGNRDHHLHQEKV
jgi:hypothetical protein